MKKICFLFFLLSAFYANAQNTTVNLSKQFKLKDLGLTGYNGTTLKFGDSYYSAEYDHKNSTYDYKLKPAKIKYGINLFKYDANMKEIKKISLNGGKKEYGPYSPYTIIMNGRLLVFHYRLEESSIKLLLTKVDAETLTDNGTQELYTIKIKDPAFFEDKLWFNTQTIRLCWSPDRTQLLVHQQGNDNEIFSCIINSKTEITNTTVFVAQNYKQFSTQDIAFDKAGNKYTTYHYKLDDSIKCGILIQTNTGKNHFVDFNAEQAYIDHEKLNLFLSNDSMKIYVYISYQNNDEEGILLSSLDASTLSFSKPQLVPYTRDVEDKLYKMGFAKKNKNGSISTSGVSYRCNQLEDGTLVFSGYPKYIHIGTATVGGGTTATGTPVPIRTVSTESGAAGPIVSVFVKGEQSNFCLLLRKELGTDPSGFMAIPYKNTLLLIYCDTKKVAESGNSNENKRMGTTSTLVLTQAVISNDGTIISRKEIKEDPAGSNHYYLDYSQYLSYNSFVIPIGRDTINMVREFNEIVQWAMLDIQ